MSSTKIWNFYGEMQHSWAIQVTSDASSHMMMKTNRVHPPLPTYPSYFHSIWMIWNIRNMVGTHWELKGNTIDISCEPGKNEKNIPHPPSHPPKKLERKKIKRPCLYLGPSHWLHEISLPKRIYHHFWPGPSTPCNKHPTL